MSPQSIALVDLSALFKRHFMSNPKAPGESAHNTIAELRRLRDQVEHIVLCLDAPPYSRKKLYPEYKATREAPDPSEIYQKRWLYEEVQRAGFQVARHPGAEGDDVIATLARIYGESCPRVLLVGADKDLAQCVTANVLQYIPSTFEKPAMTRDPEGVFAKYGVLPERMALFLALQGDKSDNVPGVPGIGAINAAKIANKYHTVPDVIAAAEHGTDPIVRASLWKALHENRQQFVLSFRLVTLDAYLPLDHAALLERLEPQVPEEMSYGTIELDGFMGNATPPPKSEEKPKMNVEEIKSAPPANQVRGVTEGEFDPIGPSPGASGPMPPKPAPKKEEPDVALVKTPPDYGLVTEDLQPQDLRSAEVISKWLAASGLYPKFSGAAGIFAIMMRAKEMKLGMATALSGFHVIEGKVVASAQLLLALAKRSDKCEYFRKIYSGPDYAEWETKHADDPEPTRYKYTIEEARQAGLVSGNWKSRPRDMLSKTACSKLAREVYPEETLGLYAEEEFDDVRRAA